MAAQWVLFGSAGKMGTGGMGGILGSILGGGGGQPSAGGQLGGLAGLLSKGYGYLFPETEMMTSTIMLGEFGEAGGWAAASAGEAATMLDAFAPEVGGATMAAEGLSTEMLGMATPITAVIGGLGMLGKSLGLANNELGQVPVVGGVLGTAQTVFEEGTDLFLNAFVPGAEAAIDAMGGITNFIADLGSGIFDTLFGWLDEGGNVKDAPKVRIPAMAFMTAPVLDSGRYPSALRDGRHFPAILKDDETVFTKKQMQQLSRTPSVEIHIHGDVVDHDKFARKIVPAIQKAIAEGVH